MTCKDCLSYRSCYKWSNGWLNENMADGCEHFKNKADFVEVCRCIDCKKAMETTEKWNGKDKYFCDRHHSFVLANGFCSDGERRDTE